MAHSRVFVYRGPLLSHLLGVAPSTFTMEYVQEISKSHVAELETLFHAPQQIQDLSDISTNLQPSRKSVQAQQNSHTENVWAKTTRSQTNTKNNTFRTFWCHAKCPQQSRHLNPKKKLPSTRSAETFGVPRAFLTTFFLDWRPVGLDRPPGEEPLGLAGLTIFEARFPGGEKKKRASKAYGNMKYIVGLTLVEGLENG